MSKLIKTFLLIIALGLTFSANSDSLKVERLAENPMDISARTANVRDINNELCALVRVALPIEGCKFEGNIMKAEYDVGEYLVFLSSGTKMFRIKCPGAVPLDIRFSDISNIESLESGTTYTLSFSGYEALLQIGSGKKADAGGNYLVLEVTPKTDVMVRVDDMLQKVEDGQALTFLRYGTHTYDVQAKGYAPEKGTVTIGKGERTLLRVNLRSARATVDVKSTTPGTSIFVNGTQVGTDTYRGDFAAGTYLVEASKEGHRPFSQTVELAEGETKTLQIPALSPIYGALNIGYTPVDSQVAIDGKGVGSSPGVFNDITVGSHKITISKPGYATVTTTVNITEGETANLTGSLQSNTNTSQNNPGTLQDNNSPLQNTTYSTLDAKITQEFVNNLPQNCSDLGNFSDGLASVRIGDKYGFIDKRGKLVILAEYDDASSFSEGLAKVKIGGQWGYIDKGGKLVFPDKYEDAASFSEGLARVKIGGKFGFIDKSGNLAIPAEYLGAESFSDGLAWVNNKGKIAYIDKNGKLVIKANKYMFANSFSEGFAAVWKEGKWGFIDKSGKLVIPAEYLGDAPFCEGLARININWKSGFIDKSGKLVIPAEYKNAYNFSEGLAGVEIREKWGFIDKSGRLVIPAEYEGATSFSEGLSCVRIGGKYGFIDKSGKLVIPAKYDYVSKFSDGLAPVYFNGKRGYIDKSGRSTFDFQ